MMCGVKTATAILTMLAIIARDPKMAARLVADLIWRMVEAAHFRAEDRQYAKIRTELGGHRGVTRASIGTAPPEQIGFVS